jgi:5-methylcytosine-specific restriction protein B
VLTDGALLQHAERARHSDIPHVLIIEEINRGNPAQAFGEMLTLIEKSMRNEESALSLSYPRYDGEQFYLPDNLYLLGTMNVADRSLALVDFALRRRFSFETLEPALSDAWAKHLTTRLPKNDQSLVKAIQVRIEALNELIRVDPMLGSHYAIGHSFVTPVDSQSDGRAWFRGVVQTEIAPLLREYWFDDQTKADEAIAALAL